MGENPGARNRLFTIRKKQTVKDTDGSFIDGYVVVAEKVWGRIRTSTGTATVKAASTLAGNLDVPVRYTIRLAYRRGVERGMEAVMQDGTVFQIRLVSHDLATREWTDLVCEQGAVHDE